MILVPFNSRAVAGFGQLLRQRSQQRRWWRIHLSTFVLLLPVVFVLAVLNVPATIGPSFELSPTYYLGYRGWPYVFATGPIKLPPKPQRASLKFYTETPALHFRNWIAPQAFEDSAGNRAILLDAAVAVSIMVVCGLLIELRRRRRRQVWQMTLAELLTLTTVVALPCAWLSAVKHAHDREEAAFMRLQPLLEHQLAAAFPTGNNATDESPAWVCRLLGNDHRTWFNRHHSLILAAPASTIQPLLTADELTIFAHLQKLSVTGPVLSQDNLLTVAQTAALDDLVVSGLELTPEAIAQLARRPGLQRIRLGNMPLDNRHMQALVGADAAVRSVWISGIMVTEEMIETLVDSPNLTSILLWGCKGMKPDLADRLKQRRPEATVNLNGNILRWHIPQPKLR